MLGSVMISAFVKEWLESMDVMDDQACCCVVEHTFCVIAGYKVCENCDSSYGAITRVPFHHYR
jgi:hypothetical protein